MEDRDVSREGAKVAKGNQDLFIVSFTVLAPSRETGSGQTAAARRGLGSATAEGFCMNVH
jgi:hypothetical protein